MNNISYQRPEKLFPVFASITSLEGVGPKVAASFQKLGVTRVRDLLFVLPVNGIKRTKLRSLQDVVVPSFVTLEITIIAHTQSKKRAPIRVLVSDSVNNFDLVFFHFGLDWVKKILPKNEKRIISGKLEWFSTGFQIVHPDYIISLNEPNTIPDFEPVYPLTKGLTQRILSKNVKKSIANFPKVEEWINPSLIKKYCWPKFKESLLRAHNPVNIDNIDSKDLARERLAFDELFSHQVSLSLARKKLKRSKGISIIGTNHIGNTVLRSLSFDLTQAQKRVISEISEDLEAASRMNRLLQGDVGSGKTIVALFAMLKVVEFGGQAAFLAPTDILARQHLYTIQEFTKMTDVKITILSGRDKGVTKRKKLEDILEGNTQIIIGTHALFQESVIYKNLRLAIIDEQHRFGVHQRMELGNKGYNVDILIMTATPIPRSLSLTYYGDMDFSILDQKPKNRKPISTAVIPESRIDSVLDRLEISLDCGRRAYWVCPLVEDSEILSLTSAQFRLKSLLERFPSKSIGLVHGQMSGQEKDEIMHKFATGKMDLLVSTTVIEVGVDVPEASIIIIEGAERFGLAQLHQLRGRVGRGVEQSSCILIYTGTLGKNSKARLEILRETEDGFKISEEDLKIRGAGDVLGLEQSGLPQFEVANLESQAHLMEIARVDSRMILDLDPDLTSQRGLAIRQLLDLMDLKRSLQYITVG